MKNIASILMLLFVTVAFAQNDTKPKFVKQGNQTQATYYHDNGQVEQQGYFNKENKLQGTWTSFDASGNKVAVGRYDNGKKVGKWLFWSNDALTEVDYVNNTIANVSESQGKTRVATTN